MFRRGLLEIDKNGFLEHAKNLLMGSGEWERLEKKFKDGGIVLEKG